MLVFSKAIEGFLLFAQAEKATATIELYTCCLGIALRHFGDVDIETITTDDLIAFMTWLRVDYEPNRLKTSTRIGQSLSDSAIDNHWKTLRSFFRWCEKTLKVNNPAIDLPRKKFDLPEVIPFSQNEIERLIKAATYVKGCQRKRPKYQRDRAIIMLLLDTGIRVGEMCRIRMIDVRLDAGEMTIRPFSTGRKSKPE